MPFRKTAVRMIQSPLLKAIFIPVLISILFYLVYSVVVLYALDYSYVQKPVLKAFGVLLSVIICLVFFRLYLKRSRLGSDEWYNGLTSYTAYRSSLAGEILIFLFILYDYTIHHRIQWLIIGILGAMVLTEMISMRVYTIRN